VGEDARGLDLDGALARFGPRLEQIYGQGECPMTITRLTQAMHVGDPDDPAFLKRLTSVGTRFDRVQIRIDSPHVTQAPGRTGEIFVKSPIVMKGYLGQSARRDEVFTDGWLRTGDVGYFDEEGFLHLSDRSKDVIISGGSNIYSREVEDVLTEHPGVIEIAVVGRPHDEWGEEAIAIVGHGAMPAPTTDELDALCCARIARFKRPRHYIFMPELPKNAYGKIEKRLLKQQLPEHF